MFNALILHLENKKWSAEEFSLFYFNNITKSFIVPSLLTEGNLNEIWYKNVAHLYRDKQKWNTKLCESSQISNVKALTQKNSYCWFSEKGIYLFSTNYLILGLRNKLLTRWNNPTITIKEYQAIFVSNTYSQNLFCMKIIHFLCELSVQKLNYYKTYYEF